MLPIIHFAVLAPRVAKVNGINGVMQVTCSAQIPLSDLLLECNPSPQFTSYINFNVFKDCASDQEAHWLSRLYLLNELLSSRHTTFPFRIASDTKPQVVSTAQLLAGQTAIHYHL